MKKLTIIGSILAFPVLAFAEDSVESTLGTGVSSSQSKANVFSVDYSLRKNSVIHEETSSDSDFESFNSRSDIPTHYLGMSYWRDLNMGSMGLMLGGYLGGFYGQENLKENEDYNYTSSDTYSGLEAGFGARLYYKFMSYGLITRPYLGVRSLKSQGQYFLRYETDSFGRSIEMDYTEEATVIESSLGVSFTKPLSGYSSFIALTSSSKTQDTVDVKAKKGEDNTLKITELAEFESESLSLSIGFAKFF